ncbi:MULTISPECIES: acyl-CoA dehydrogenase family protein [unclassified Streptomyces]|uniref:acyl-CoA dehydrogenase family protein n=1 Tax=unclassified Streptomyces TaxID=2593676 RepID=UPI0022540139|nr:MULTISPECIES: acyl-CoA dehydrogenase family protein [unclassified Streptomyces]MCX4990230.1 acyl-CoA/acyl-ACP dehydrogenase [Streptomyces sp. NBC_00568]MCX5004539.1 acyl-CoA/acyl-ACP dehydrogenase [Streptomyces sp. NBC_00638]
MDFRLTDDQRALRQGVRELLEGRFGRAALRAAVDRGEGERGGVLDRELWRELGAAGFFALRLPEADGGVGQGLPEAVLAFEEAGRVLLPGPLIATHLAAGAVAGAATGEVVVTSVDEGLVEWLDEADVVRGDTTGAEPLASVDPLTPLHRLPASAAPRPASGALRRPRTTGGPGGPPMSDGPGGFPVSDGPGGFRVSDGPGGFRVSDGPGGPPAPDGPGGSSVSDGSGGLPVPDALGSPASPPAGDALLTSLLTAAEQLGSAARTCEAAVQHARTREQFGQPIGAFQAVQHLCAGMLVRVEMARAAVYAASVTADPVDIAAARLLADEAAVRGARDCLQVHGGMGFTWESDIHLHLKRAWIRTHRAGGTTRSEEELADDLPAGTA